MHLFHASFPRRKKSVKSEKRGIREGVLWREARGCAENGKKDDFKSFSGKFEGFLVGILSLKQKINADLSEFFKAKKECNLKPKNIKLFNFFLFQILIVLKKGESK